MTEHDHTQVDMQHPQERKDVGARLELVLDDERLKYHTGASTIFYRRLTLPARNRFLQKATKRGQTDYGLFQTLALKWCVLGWDNVNMGGQAIPYEEDLVDRLPQDAILDLQDLTGAKAAEDEERLGN